MVERVYESLEPDDLSPSRVPFKAKAYSTSPEQLRIEKQEIIDRDPGYDEWIEWVASGGPNNPDKPFVGTPVTADDLLAEIKAQGGNPDDLLAGK